MAANRIELALAVAGHPLSLDSLLDWGLARPGELWAVIDDGTHQGFLAEDAAAGRGHFVFEDEQRRAEVLSQASVEDFDALVSCRALVGDILAAARRAAAEKMFRPAGAMYRALLMGAPAEALAGGERDWLAAAIELSRIYPEMYGLSADVIDRAVATAAAQGDRAAEALLIAARGLHAIFAAKHEEGHALMDRALMAAFSLPGPVRTRVHMRFAAAFVRQGHLREAIATFEELLGDVPDELGAHAGELIDLGAAAPASAIANVAFAYTNTGQYARALDVLHRVLAYGEQLGRPELVTEMRLFIGMQHAMWGNFEAAVAPTELAWEHYRATGAEPMYAWYTAATLALVRASEGKRDETRALLEAGQRFRLAAGNPPLMGPLAFHIEELLGTEVFDGIPGMEIVPECERAIGVENPYTGGMAHRLLGRQVARAAHDDAGAAAARERFAKAIVLLREAGAVVELLRAYEDSAELARRFGRVEEAKAFEDQERSLRASVPALQGADGGSRYGRFARVVLDLGRLGIDRQRQGAFWGEVAARLSRGLGADRVALAELVGEARLLAARGGDAEFGREVLALAARPVARPEFVDTADGVQRVVIPFGTDTLGRRGYAVLENRHAPALVSRQDADLLDALGAQLGILFGNVLLWQELARAREKLEQENRYYRESQPAPLAGGNIVAHSPAMARVLDLVARVAPTTATVLVLGETGVGKELVAHEVHRRSTRAGGPFIAVHIASLAPGLVASGLFGHERGAFTGATEQHKGRFELADGGTIFLDEVGELAPEDQVRLLRVLQEGTFERVGGTRPLKSDFRLVAATNRNLEAEVRAGRFREDLFFRLNVFPIEVPPLRERKEEIPTLALLFMERFGRNVGRKLEGISQGDMERLLAYAWPGNVRELEHLVERAVLLSDGPRLRIPELERAAPAEPAEAEPRDDLVTLEESERRHIARVLERTHGRVTGAGGAAEILALRPSTLNWHIDKLGLRDVLARARAERPRRQKVTVGDDD